MERKGSGGGRQHAEVLERLSSGQAAPGRDCHELLLFVLRKPSPWCKDSSAHVAAQAELDGHGLAGANGVGGGQVDHWAVEAGKVEEAAGEAGETRAGAGAPVGAGKCVRERRVMCRTSNSLAVACVLYALLTQAVLSGGFRYVVKTMVMVPKYHKAMCRYPAAALREGAVFVDACTAVLAWVG